jgi:hypothetical protein
LEDKHTTTIFNVYGEKLIFAAEIQWNVRLIYKDIILFYSSIEFTHS